MKTISVGVLVLHQGKILLGHSTGNRHWDIPKGMLDGGESEVLGALRELQEEFGIVLTEPQLCPLGKFDYNPKKDLVLFQWDSPSLIELSALKCTSFFPHFKTKKETPEIDRYEWVMFSEISSYCVPNLVKVLSPLLK